MDIFRNEAVSDGQSQKQRHRSNYLSKLGCPVFLSKTVMT